LVIDREVKKDVEDQFLGDVVQLHTRELEPDIIVVVAVTANAKIIGVVGCVHGQCWIFVNLWRERTIFII